MGIETADKQLQKKIENLSISKQDREKLLEIFQCTTYKEASSMLDHIHNFDLADWFAWYDLVIDILQPTINAGDQERVYREIGTTILTIWKMNVNDMEEKTK